MKRWPVLALASGLAGAGGARAAVRRARAAADPHAGEVLEPPAGTRERWIAAHDGGRLHVLERGPETAPPLVLLHGITLQALTWVYQLRDLAGPFRVVAIDQRGHGRSVPGTDGYSLDALAADVASVLGDLDRPDAIVLGHSMGAAGLMRAARSQASALERWCRGVVFLSAGPGFELPALGERAVAVLNGAGLRATEAAGFRGMYRFADNDLSWLLARLAFGRSPSPTHVDWTRAMLAEIEPERSIRAGFGMGDHDGIRAIRSLALPALVIVGSQDKLTPPRLARRIAGALPNGRLEVVDGAGHQLMLEAPGALAELLSGFAASLSQQPTRSR